MRNRRSHRAPLPATRREFLESIGGGFGVVGLAALMARDGVAAVRPPHDAPHHPPRVERVIQLFMNGGASQMDTFDYKPELEKRHGKKVDFGVKTAVTSTPGAVMKCPFEWKRHGESGRWVSSVFPNVARHVDDMAFLMAMRSKTNVHGPASYLQNTGFLEPGFPCMGAWISYGLGRLTDNLPTFVVLPDARGLPYNNAGNFSAGFLSPAHQATVIKTSSESPIPLLHPPRGARHITRASEREGLDLLRRLNTSHATRDGSSRSGAARGGASDPRLEARIESFELAARLQLSAPEALDLRGERESTRRLYGLDDEHTAGFGKNCLTARRLVERGVRVVQVWSGAGGNQKNWDNHGDIPRELPFIASSVDRPIAGLLEDLKQRGLLDTTLVIWTTEFGRMPFTQGAKGRDHNGGTFVTWLAGGRVRGGVAHGASDEFSFRAAEKVTTCYDLHATVLHLLGIDHEKLTVRHNGFDRRLTDVHGHVVREVLA